MKKDILFEVEKLLLPFPKAATSEEWDAWRKQMKKERPLRYWLVYTFFNKLRYGRKISDFKWAILHRFHPKHRYNIVRLNLEPGYYDPDDRILHAIFDETSRYVDWNKKEKLFDWNYDKSHREVWAELIAIDRWWKIERPAAWKKHDKETLKIYKMKKGPEKDKAHKEHWKQEETLHKKDEEMICRIAKIRRSMWY